MTYAAGCGHPGKHAPLVNSMFICARNACTNARRLFILSGNAHDRKESDSSLADASCVNKKVRIGKEGTGSSFVSAGCWVCSVSGFFIDFRFLLFANVCSVASKKCDPPVARCIV